MTERRAEGRMDVFFWTWVPLAFSLSFGVSRQPYATGREAAGFKIYRETFIPIDFEISKNQGGSLPSKANQKKQALQTKKSKQASKRASKRASEQANNQPSK